MDSYLGIKAIPLSHLRHVPARRFLSQNTGLRGEHCLRLANVIKTDSVSSVAARDSNTTRFDVRR